jgi:hypothetical protein
MRKSWHINKKQQTNSVALVRERNIPTGRPPLTTKLVPTFADSVYQVVSATDPHGRIPGFLDRSHYSSFQAAPQLYLRGWVHPVPDSLLLRDLVASGIEPGSSGFVTKNSDINTFGKFGKFGYCRSDSLQLSLRLFKTKPKSEAWNDVI